MISFVYLQENDQIKGAYRKMAEDFNEKEKILEQFIKKEKIHKSIIKNFKKKLNKLRKSNSELTQKYARVHEEVSSAYKKQADLKEQEFKRER